MAVARQLRNTFGEAGHGSEICARQMGVRHPNTDNALTEQQQLHQGKGINACLGQRAVFVKIRPFGDKIRPRELAKLRGNGLGVLLWSHC